MRDPEPRPQDGIELPAGTSAPVYFALGLTLLLASLVTHPLVAVVGLGFAIGGGWGWWREVLPHEHEEWVPLRSEAARAKPITPRHHMVEHLEAGRDQHRLRLPVAVRPYSAGLRAGAVGGVAMAVVACAYGMVAHASPWLPINLLAGAVLPAFEQADLTQLQRFDTTALMLAIPLHASLSLLVGLIYAALLPMLPDRPLLWGGIAAPLAWSALLGLTLGAIDPVLAQHISWPWFVASQAAFGLAAGYTIAQVEPIATLQALPLAERAGLEASGLPLPAEEDE